MTAVVVAAGVAGCASPGPSRAPAKLIEPRAAGIEAGVQSESVSAGWWRELGDERLTALVEAALAGSPGLQVIEARIAGARALVDEAEAGFEPSAELGADLNRQRYSANGLLPATVAGKVRTIANLQAGMSWELDFFGRHRSALEAALGRERAMQAEAQAARALLAVQVAQAYLQLARLVEQRALIDEWLVTREAQQALSAARVQAGLDDAAGLRAAELAVAELRRQRALTDEATGAARRVLAHLSAQPPASLNGLSPRLGFGPRLATPLDVPADLIGRRADLSAARWRVEASVRDIESARARFYPNINLGALIGLNSIGLDRLFEGSSWQVAAAPAIRLPIFEAGRLRAALRARQAELDLAVASYNQVLLDAVREVADRLGTLRGIGEQLDEHARAQVAAQAQLEIARQRLQAGLGNRMAVLAAEGGVIVQRQQELELRTRLLENRLGLIRALGGGYAADPVTLSIRTQP